MGETNVLGHDDGADHAGAQVALLAWRNEVLGHGGVRRGNEAGDRIQW
jgi:hypothetical protein